MEAGCKSFVVVWLLSVRQHKTTSEGIWSAMHTADQTGLICRPWSPVFVLPSHSSLYGEINSHFITAIKVLALCPYLYKIRVISVLCLFYFIFTVC